MQWSSGAALGIGASVEQESVPPGDAGVYTAAGRALIRVPAGSKRVPPVRLISRRRLMELLVEAADGIEIRTGVTADDAAMRDALAGADVLVGADGVHSSVRHAFFGDATRPRYSGLVAWRGSVGFEAPDQGETWGEGLLFGLTPMEPGRTNFYAAVPAPEHEPGSFAAIRDRFASWRSPIPSVLAAVDDADVLHNPIHDLHPPLPSYVAGRVVLLGDAAHAMTPHVGRGASEAITDAACLVDQLGQHDVTEALPAYDQARRRPSQKNAARSAQMMRLVHSRRIAPLRNGLLRAAAPFIR